MLGIWKRWKFEREARKRIGVELHRQIRDAFEDDETGATARLQTSFCVGYIYCFVMSGLSSIAGVDDDRAVDKHLRHICDGVIPTRLYDIFSRQLAALEIARQMEDKSKKFPGSNISPRETIELFETGSEAGTADGSCFMPIGAISKRNLPWKNLRPTTSRPDNLRRYLTGRDLSYRLL